MKDINKIRLDINSTIKEALKIIDDSSLQIAIVLDNESKLLGTVTDGDIRRAFLSGATLETKIEDIYFRTPTVANINDTKEEVINLCSSKKIHQIPIINDEGKVISIDTLDELLAPTTYKNKVFLMVGGLGKRLRPLTENIPKPMLDVGGKPILQTIVEKFASYGFVNIIMCIGYKSQIIQNYFGDGSKFGVSIEYILEEDRMGTAGALSLLSCEQTPEEPFFVMNGDLLTNINFEHILKYHIQNNAMATMCVREYEFQVPYGVVNIENSKIISVVEKPMHKFFISAGIYMLNSDVLKYIPKNEFYDMPTLFEKMIEKGFKSISFPIKEYWVDIGRIEEYKKANLEYDKFFL